MTIILLVPCFHLTCLLLDLLRTVDTNAWPLFIFFQVAFYMLCRVQEGDLGALERQQQKIHAG